MLGETVSAPRGSQESTIMRLSRPRLLAPLLLLGFASLVLGPALALAGVYGFIYGQTGLMAGLGLQGSKITEIEP